MCGTGHNGGKFGNNWSELAIIMIFLKLLIHKKIIKILKEHGIEK
jgi:hypothetical protein